MMPLTCGAFLAWQEWGYRQGIALAVPPLVTQSTAPPREQFDATAVSTVLGFTTDAKRQASAEPLTLQASFVMANGLSKALLAGAQGSRVYQVGDGLPGGSVLRRVEPGQVVLWNKGREEFLTLQPSTQQFLRALQLRGAPNPAQVPARFLRPVSGLSE